MKFKSSSFIVWVTLLVLYLKHSSLPKSGSLRCLLEVLYFKFGRSMIHFFVVSFLTLHKVWNEVFFIAILFLWMWITNYSSTICWKTIFSVVNCFCTFVKNKLTIYVTVWIFWTCYSVPFFYLSILITILWCFDYCLFIIWLINVVLQI